MTKKPTKSKTKAKKRTKTKKKVDPFKVRVANSGYTPAHIVEARYLAQSGKRESWLSLRIPKDLSQRVTKLSKMSARSKADITILALEAYLKRHQIRNRQYEALEAGDE